MHEKTPLIELSHYNSADKKFLAKLEGKNPSGSLKDRMTYFVIKELEKIGRLKKGMTIVEASSGNTGISLARIGSELGYRILICTPRHTSPEKKRMISGYGAVVKEFDTTRNSETDIEAARELGKKQNHYFFNQFSNPYCVDAYYETLGKETVSQLSAMKTQIDCLVAGVGTGGSLIGLGTKLREENPKMKIYAVGPKKSPTKIEGLHPGHIRGDFDIWKKRPKSFENGYILIDDREAIKYAMELQKTQRLSVGISSGAVLAAALNHIKIKGNYLLLFADSGNRYKTLYSQFR